MGGGEGISTWEPAFEHEEGGAKDNVPLLLAEVIWQTPQGAGPAALRFYGYDVDGERVSLRYHFGL